MIASIILAAGKGTRMKSKIPKVLHKVAGRPLIWYVCDAATQLNTAQNIVVVGYEAEQVKKHLGRDFQDIYQEEQLGTGHAVMLAKKAIDAKIQTVVVLCGDAPLLTVETLQMLLEHHAKRRAAVTVLSAFVPDSTGYGRIVRDENCGLKKIVEEKDASAQEKTIKEINSGTYCFNKEQLFVALEEVNPENKQAEYYLTDVIEILQKKQLGCEVVIAKNASEVLGINNKAELAEADRFLRQRINSRLMLDGVTIIDPYVTYIDASVRVGRDTIIQPFCRIEGDTQIGEDCIIGPQAQLKDAQIGDCCRVFNSLIVEATVGASCNIGPYSYLRPGASLADGVKVGGCVEVKKTSVGENSKIPHLSYIGDSIIGKNVNVGAGTITCNYDGMNKHLTILEDDVFVGSNANLVAPVKVGQKAVIGAGSTITKDVPPEALAIERSKQIHVSDWASRRNKKEGD
jgi:bifunctional UDP-N-acetylglucosamine pyrophosphorylase/glucosamine-1-phosphate N-acetyltransferase